MKAPKVAFLLLVLLIGASCSTTKSVNKKIDQRIETAEAFENGFTGFVLYDPQKKEILFEHNGEKYFTPASNTKLFTFYTGLKVLGDSVPALKYTVRNDTLFFWGTGDPTFLHRDFPDNKTLDFLKNRKEELVYVNPVYEEKHFGPGWAWSDFNWYYSVERASFPIYGNYVAFRFEPSDSIPRAMPSYFQDSLEAEGNYEGNSSVAFRDLSENHFTFRHRSGEEDVQDVPFVHSPELAIDLLSDTLQREISIKYEVPEDFEPVNTLYSVPTDSIYKRMLQVSDNFIAEQILLMSAGALTDTLKADLAIDYMQEHFLKDLPHEPQWVDGSGLSRYNLFTPRTMVGLLEKISEEVPQERLFSLLPAGGESGTIKNLYKAEEPYVFAKTGTLNNNHSLSGFLRARSGKVFIFSFMNSNYVVPSSEIKDVMEQVLRTIYLNY